jgi:hypothetical protein
MNDIPWFVEYKKILRLAALTLLVIAMLGPWMFDVINVPAEYTCSLPNVRLYGDFCGLPLSGFEFFKLFIGGFFYMLFTFAFVNYPRELLIGLYILPLIPFVTSLILLWKEETGRLRTINLIAWILALIPTLTLFVFEINRQAIRLWGLWLYLLSALSAIILEAFINREQSIQE